MSFSKHLSTVGYVNSASIKRTYALSPGKTTQREPSPILEDPVIENGQLQQEVDVFRKAAFTDIVVKGQICTPGNQPKTSQEAGIRIGSTFVQLSVTGQRYLKLINGVPQFSSPEPFTNVPLVWEEAYGGTDTPNENVGDLWDLKKLGQSMGKDLSQLNLNRYRRNPFGKGYILQLKHDHQDSPLPRVEFSNQLLTAQNIAVGNPIRWHSMPSPACFLWQSYSQFPRMAFLGGKLNGNMNKQVPEMPMAELDFGYSREDLFGVVSPDKLHEHPRFFNGAHPALQVPLLKKTTPITLYHFDPEITEFSFHIPGKAPILKLEPPGHGKTYKQEATLSQVVIDMTKKELSTTWHAFIRTKLPVLPDYTEHIKWDVSW